MNRKIMGITLFLVTALVLISAVTIFAQTTEFTYQGKLADTGTPSPTYDFQFRLCASESDCSTPLAVSSQSSVTVSSGGIFTVKLNFGAVAFDGSDRFLEVAVRRAGETNYTVLAPRQKLTSSPYSIQSLKANDTLKLGGTAANQFVMTGDTRLDPNNYVQNTNTAQSGVNFNVGGTGTANILNAATQFNIGGNRILSNSGSGNLFAGAGAGAASTPLGGNNSFFGSSAGNATTNGIGNSFFGSSAGSLTTTGGGNTFIGNGAGGNNSSGNANTFIGGGSGGNNSSGVGNTALGISSGIAGASQTNSTAIGAYAYVSQSNSLVLGGISGVNGATADTKVGIGTTAPTSKLDIAGSDAIAIRGSQPYLTFFDTNASSLRGRIQNIGGSLSFFTANGISSNTPTLVLNNTGAPNLKVNGSIDVGTVKFNPFFSGQLSICVVSSSDFSLAQCSSSLRYKTDLQPYAGGMDVINRLHPITFKWKSDGSPDLGFGAEPVGEIEPLLVTHNQKGEIEGVKYDRLSTVFVNAFKEQQTQIETQAAQIKQQQKQIDELKKLVCAMKPEADICREN